MSKVFFIPSGRSVEVNTGETIMKAAQIAKIDLGGFCNGNGTCKKCNVNIIDIEEKEKTVLACQYKVNNDLIVKTKDEQNINVDNTNFDLEYGKEVLAAIDIGTTSLVISLFDAKTKKEFRRVSSLNHQVLFGADVISRIKYSLENEENIFVLQKSITNQINEMIGQLKEGSYITNYVISGNTSMSHFVLGIRPTKLGENPFEPSYEGAYVIDAASLGLSYGKAQVYVVSNIKKHVGGDILAGIMTIKDKKGLNVLVDIGTNGEIVCWDDKKMLCASTAMGPALEGAGISCGMRACDGAISKIEIINGKINYLTIGNKKPIGICGSGIISAIYELSKAGMIDKTGKIVSGEKQIYIDLENNIYISQKDIREVQLVKAALFSGILILVKNMGKTIEEIDNLFIAGEFGKHIETESAIGIGLIPCINNINTIGNSSINGACKLLLNPALKEKSEKIVKEIEHIDLSNNAEFIALYTSNMWFNQN